VSEERTSRGGLAAALDVLVLALGVVAVDAAVASAHTGAGGFVLLLPTHLYIAGGIAVVAVSFAVMALLPSTAFTRAATLEACLELPAPRATVRRGLSTAASLLSLAVALGLITAGHVGSRDPLSNPLPLFVWTIWWVGFTYLHALLGNLWAHLNPWSGVHHVLTAAGPLRRWREQPPLAYPAGAAHWPALAGLLVFAWFELIDPAPADPARLATAVGCYLLAGFVGIALFGERAWLGQAETFSVFFRMISWLSPLTAHGFDEPGRRARLRIRVGLPTRRLLSVDPPPPSGVAFILLALSTVSFDGLSRTFAWLALVGVNPLDYPGRSALIAPNTAGLVALSTLLALGYVVVVWLADRIAPMRAPTNRLLGAFVLSIVPIAFGYHFAHYLPVFLVDAQYALRALSDPFGRGWDLLGTADLYVMTGFLSEATSVYRIWHTQVAIIVAAHVAAVYLAHVLALRLTAGPRAAARSQAPVLALMIGYTLLGLWLLATPSAG
jgi:hypothetical protein